jgi:hypothetical protein
MPLFGEVAAPLLALSFRSILPKRSSIDAASQSNRRACTPLRYGHAPASLAGQPT